MKLPSWFRPPDIITPTKQQLKEDLDSHIAHLEKKSEISRKAYIDSHVEKKAEKSHEAHHIVTNCKQLLSKRVYMYDETFDPDLGTAKCETVKSLGALGALVGKTFIFNGIKIHVGDERLEDCIDVMLIDDAGQEYNVMHYSKDTFRCFKGTWVTHIINLMVSINTHYSNVLAIKVRESIAQDSIIKSKFTDKYK